MASGQTDRSRIGRADGFLPPPLHLVAFPGAGQGVEEMPHVLLLAAFSWFVRDLCFFVVCRLVALVVVAVVAAAIAVIILVVLVNVVDGIAAVVAAAIAVIIVVVVGNAAVVVFVVVDAIAAVAAIAVIIRCRRRQCC